MKKVWVLLCCFCAMISQTRAENEMVGEILNKASTQQLLSQRICKSYFAILLDLDKENQTLQIEADINAFEDNQKLLRGRLPAQSMLNALQNVDVMWLEFKPLLQTSSKENAIRLIDINNSLFRLSGAVITQVQEYGKKFSENAEQGNTSTSYKQTLQLAAYSGEERTLSQCILALILAEKLGISPNKEEMSKATNRFSQLLKNLENALQNSPEIDYTLVRLASDWKRFESLISNTEQLSNEGLIDLISTSDILMNGMNEISNLYEEQIDKQLTSLILSEIIEKANQQTTLTQQIANAKLSEQMETGKMGSKELKNYLEQFNKNHQKLKEFASISRTEQEFATVEKLWKNFEKSANQPTNKENCTELLAQNTAIYEACQNATAAVETFANRTSNRYNSAFSHLVQQAHRQRILSQRVVLYCLAVKGNFKTQYAEEYLAQASEEYTETLIALIALPQNTPEISEKLNKAYKNWEKIAENCEKATIVKFDNKGDFSQSDKLIADMDEIARLYQKLVDNMLIDEAINKAGRQRMLSQRICKSYIALLMNIDTSNQQKQLAKDIVLFESQLNELRAFVSNDELKIAFEQVLKIWKNYKTTLQKQPNTEGMNMLLSNSTDLLNACHQTVLLLEKSGNRTQFSTIINTSGRQRMLSQRFMMYYLAYNQSDKKNSEWLAAALKVLSEFETGLEFLSVQKINNKAIDNKINDIRRQYEKIAKYKNDLSKVDFYQIWLVADILLAESETLTRNYEKLTGR